MSKRRNGCNGKVAHASLDASVVTLRKLGNPGLGPYPCKVCGAWHLGNVKGASRDWKLQRRLDQLLSRNVQTDA